MSGQCLWEFYEMNEWTCFVEQCMYRENKCSWPLCVCVCVYIWCVMLNETMKKYFLESILFFKFAEEIKRAIWKPKKSSFRKYCFKMSRSWYSRISHVDADFVIAAGSSVTMRGVAGLRPGKKWNERIWFLRIILRVLSHESIICKYMENNYFKYLTVCFGKRWTHVGCGFVSTCEKPCRTASNQLPWRSLRWFLLWCWGSCWRSSFQMLLQLSCLWNEKRKM